MRQSRISIFLEPLRQGFPFQGFFLLYLIIWADGGIQAFRVGANDQAGADEKLSEKDSSEVDLCSSVDAGACQEANQAKQARLEASVGLQMHRAGLELHSSLESMVRLIKPAVEKMTNLMKEQASSRESVDDAKDSARKLAEEVKQVRAADARFTQIASTDAAKRNPLAFNVVERDTFSNSQEEDEMPRPFSPLADLAEGIAAVGDLLPEDKREELLSKASVAIEQHVTMVQNMNSQAEQASSLGGNKPVEEVIDDSDSEEKLTADKQEVADLAATSGPTDETGGEANAENSLASWSVLDMDVEKMDVFMRIKVCQMLKGLDCESCSEGAKSLPEYQSCVKKAIANRTNEIKAETAKLAATAMLKTRVNRGKWQRAAPMIAGELAFHGLQFYGIHRNWAQWSNMGENPMWPMETLKGQKAKDGWSVFTKDSQTILDKEIAEFGGKASKIAEKEAKASATWVYKKHAEEEVQEAQKLKTDGEKLASDAESMQAESQDLMAKAENNMEKAEKLNGEAADLQEDNQKLVEEIEAETAKCEAQPPVDCDPDKIQELGDKMENNAKRAEKLNEDAQELKEDAGEMKEDANEMKAKGEKLQNDAKDLKKRAGELQKAAKEKMDDPQIRADIAAEARRCALRIADQVKDIALQHAKSALLAILALVPDLLLAAVEAALDIITGFGWIITALRLTYKFGVWARKQYKAMRDRREQKICKPDYQMRCCVNSVMAWRKKQEIEMLTTEEEFMNSTASELKNTMGKQECHAWVPTLFDEAPQLEGLGGIELKRESLERHSPDKLETVPVTVHKTRLGSYSAGRTKIDMQMFITTGVVVASKITQQGTIFKVTEFPVTCEDFLPGEKGAASLQAISRPGIYEGDIKFILGPKNHVMKFAIKTNQWQFFDDEERMPTLCAIVWRLCHAGCRQPSRCDAGIDKMQIPEAGLVAAGADLLQQCVGTEQHAKIQGVIEEEELDDTPVSYGPAALRVLVWNDLLHEGQSKPRSEPESRALAHAMCSKHVLPSWRCGQEECAICEGVGSLMMSHQSPQKWCMSFRPGEKITPGVKSRDVGRHYKCKYIAEYFQRTEDYNRFYYRKNGTRTTCMNRGMCTPQTAKLPRAILKPINMDPLHSNHTHKAITGQKGDMFTYGGEASTMHHRRGSQQPQMSYGGNGTTITILDPRQVEHEDTWCRLCVEFVQRAASGMSPIEYCKHWSGQMYQVQQDECERRLKTMSENISKLKIATEHFDAKTIYESWMGKSALPRLIFDGKVCDHYCKGSLSRDQEINAGLTHESPLLLPKQEEGLPAFGRDEAAEAEVVAIKEDAERARKAVKWRIFDWSSPEPESMIDQILTRLDKYEARWTGLLSEFSWEGKYTNKRIWPRHGQTGIVTEKIEQAVFLMLKEVSFLNTHLSLVQKLTIAGVDMDLAYDIIEQLGTRVEKFIELLREMSAVLQQTVAAPVVPQSVKRLNKEWERDAKEISDCYKVAIKRQEKYSPILESLSESLNDVAAAVEEARREEVQYDAKTIGLTNMISEFYYMLPVEEQSYWTRVKRFLNPARFFQTKLEVGRMYDEDQDLCTSTKFRKFSNDYVGNFHDCCSARFNQVHNWENMVRETHDRLNKIVDMMDYVRGNWFTAPIRRAYRNVTNYLSGVRHYRGFWVQEEAAAFLRVMANRFVEDLNEAEQKSNQHVKEYMRHTEVLWSTYSNKKVQKMFVSRSRFSIVQMNAKTEFNNAIYRFTKVKKTIESVRARLEKKMRGEDDEPVPLIQDYMPV